MVLDKTSKDALNGKGCTADQPRSTCLFGVIVKNVQTCLRTTFLIADLGGGVWNTALQAAPVPSSLPFQAAQNLSLGVEAYCR